MVKLVTLLLTSMSLVSSFHHRPLRTTYQKKGLSASTVGRAEWADDETGLRDAPSRRKLSGPFLDNLVSSVNLRCVADESHFYEALSEVLRAPPL